MGIEVVLGFITAAGTALTSAVVYLFKLYYVDTKQALADCDKRHNEAKIEFERELTSEKATCEERMKKFEQACETRVDKYIKIIDRYQARFDALSDHLIKLNIKPDLTVKVEGDLNSGIHKPT